MPAVLDSGALLLALDDVATDETIGPPSLRLDGHVFARKIEHHLTVFGSARGRLLLAAAAIDETLVARVNELAATHEWNVSLLERFVLAIEPTPTGELRTIFALASARVAEFFSAVRALVANADDAASQALVASLASPPPPHVTLYTTDPSGRRAIGFDTIAELDAAFTREASEPGIRARWLAASDLPPPRLRLSQRSTP